MKLENQLVSLELAKKLKELGVEQLSYFYHVEYSNLGELEFDIYSQDKINSVKESGWDFEFIASAFTVAELGEMLPHMIENTNNGIEENLFLVIEFVKEIMYRNTELDKTRINFTDDTEANARAKMLIYLLENSLLDRKSVV